MIVSNAELFSGGHGCPSKRLQALFHVAHRVDAGEADNMEESTRVPQEDISCSECDQDQADLIAARTTHYEREVLYRLCPATGRGIDRDRIPNTRCLLAAPLGALLHVVGFPGVNAMRHMEQCLQALAGTTMTTREKLALLTIIDDFVFGIMPFAKRGATRTSILEVARAQLATGAFPRLKEAFGKGRLPAMPDRFQMGLRALLDLVKGTSE